MPGCGFSFLLMRGGASPDATVRGGAFGHDVRTFLGSAAGHVVEPFVGDAHEPKQASAQTFVDGGCAGHAAAVGSERKLSMAGLSPAEDIRSIEPVSP